MKILAGATLTVYQAQKEKTIYLQRFITTHTIVVARECVRYTTVVHTILYKTH